MSIMSARVKSVHLLPLVGLSCALAIGVHAGEAAKTLKIAAKPSVAERVSLPTRSAVELSREAAPGPSIEERQRQLQLREGLLAASEKRINAKLAELKELEQKNIVAPTPKAGTANTPLMSIVKIYETMKPKDAARIFEKLDLNVQLSVAGKMKERAMAALLAEMSPDAARRLTMEMVAKATFSDKSGA
jgi:flagellar motility protein MotE (MotC chaperone)